MKTKTRTMSISLARSSSEPRQSWRVITAIYALSGLIVGLALVAESVSSTSQPEGRVGARYLLESAVGGPEVLYPG